MKDWYFYQERGKTMGPVKLTDLKVRIEEGKVRLFDLIYKEGERNWRMALEHDRLRPFFRASALVDLQERPWVLLQKKSEKARDFVTSGPFAFETVKEGLLSGKVAYSDYIWREGFSQWKRIGSVPEFNERLMPVDLDDTIVTKPPPVESAADLLKNVVELKRAAPPPMLAPPPPEAVGEDLTKPKALAKPEGRVDRTTDSKREKPTEEQKARRAKSTSTPDWLAVEAAAESSVKRQKWFDWGLVGALVLVLIGSVIYLSKQFLPQFKKTEPIESLLTKRADKVGAQEEEPLPADFGQPPPGSVSATLEDKPQAGAEAAKPSPVKEAKPKIPPRAPTKLTLEARQSPKGPALDIRTDGTAEYPVYLQIVGLPGQVSEGGSFYRYIKLTPTGNSKQALELPSLVIPKGKFIVRAESAEMEKEIRFQSGVSDPQYKATVNLLRKSFAHAIWRERLQLVDLSVRLENQMAYAVDRKRPFSAKGLETLNNVKKTNGSDYLLFEQWYELRDILKVAKSGATPELLARTRQAREQIAGFSVWK